MGLFFLMVLRAQDVFLELWSWGSQAIYTGCYCGGLGAQWGPTGEGGTSGGPWRPAGMGDPERRQGFRSSGPGQSTHNCFISAEHLGALGAKAQKSHQERLRNIQPTSESKTKNENICYLPCTIQILLLFSQQKSRRYNPLIWTIIIVTKSHLCWWSSEHPTRLTFTFIVYQNSYFS